MPKDGLDSQKGTQRGPTKLKAYLICYIPSPFFPAHWSLWVAYGVGYTGPGTRIHVIGNALNGFQHDLDREYNPASDDRHPRVIDLGVIDESLLSPKAPGGIPAEGTSVDKSGACNALEHLALRIPAPGPSLRSSGSNAVCLHMSDFDKQR